MAGSVPRLRSITSTSVVPPVGFVVLTVPHTPFGEVSVFTIAPEVSDLSSMRLTPLALTLGTILPHAPFTPETFSR